MVFFHGGLRHGTHVDAPWHFTPGGKRLHEMPLEHWVGECQVLNLSAEEERITAESLEKSGVSEGMNEKRNQGLPCHREPHRHAFLHCWQATNPILPLKMKENQEMEHQ
ncbi:MAG: cyclase family protein [Proteobacteria bacterium]|nr:cyclase family protein [Pseudomonadota bacterium]